MTHLVHERFGDILIPTTGPEFDPLNWPKAGAYPLFPYHNRLVGAAFEHEGRHYEVLPHPALGAMHSTGRPTVGAGMWFRMNQTGSNWP